MILEDIIRNIRKWENTMSDPDVGPMTRQYAKKAHKEALEELDRYWKGKHES